MKLRPLRIAAGLTTLAATILASPITASAGTLDFGVGGAPAISSFTPITLTGVPQLTSLTVAPFSIVDATASLAGWHVTLTVPDLVNGGSTILASTMSMDAPTVTPSGGADPTNVVGHAAAGNFAAGEKIVTAAAGFGDGTYLISPQPVELTVPVTAKTGTYTSAATIGVVSGP
ncbi:MAG: hypothetical protein QOI55_1175 [Actinomycetota bacterium]|jgi:hypothetical protein|nr:hypothetical protein [Actinomycetota bacterium]